MCLLAGFNTLLIASRFFFCLFFKVELSYFTQEPLAWIHCSMGYIQVKGTLYSVSSFYYLIDDEVSSVNSLNKLWCNTVIIAFDVYYTLLGCDHVSAPVPRLVINSICV